MGLHEVPVPGGRHHLALVDVPCLQQHRNLPKGDTTVIQACRDNAERPYQAFNISGNRTALLSGLDQQDGGLDTHMHALAHRIAHELIIPAHVLLLLGNLGPPPWRQEPQVY